MFRPELVGYFFKNIFEKNFAKLTQEEKEKLFSLETQYGDLDLKIMKNPLYDMLNKMDNNLHWGINDTEQNPTEVYEHDLSIDRDQNMSEEEHNLKMERLRLHKEWFEKQNQ
jgi:hypothetical protein